MYTNAIYMDKYLSEGFNYMLELNKSDYNKLKINTENKKTKLEGIYSFLGFDKLFGNPEDLNQAVLEYYIKSNIPLCALESEVFEENYTKALTSVSGYKVLESDSIVVEGKNLTTAIHAKTGLQIKALIKIINSNLDYFNIFSKYYKGTIDSEQFTKKIKKFLNKNVSVIRADTNIAYKLSGSHVTLYFPESDVNLDLMNPLDYVEGLIYSEMGDSAIGLITQSIRTRVVSHLNVNGNLRNLNMTDPLLLFELEYIRRRNSCESLSGLLEEILYHGKMVIHTPNSVCYYGNLDGTVTFHVKNCEAKIDKKYLSKILADKTLTFSVLKGVVYVSSEKYQERVTLWEYLLGKSTRPVDSYNLIVESNFKL